MGEKMYKSTIFLLLLLGFVEYMQAYNMYWATLFGPINYGKDARIAENDYEQVWRQHYDATLAAYAQRHHLKVVDIQARSASVDSSADAVIKFGEKIEITEGRLTRIIEFSQESKEALMRKRQDIMTDVYVECGEDKAISSTMETFLEDLHTATKDERIDLAFIQKHNDSIIGRKIRNAQYAVASIVIGASALIAGAVVYAKMIKAKKNKQI